MMEKNTMLSKLSSKNKSHDIFLNTFVYIKGGSFYMGAGDLGEDCQPAHLVTVSDFHIGKTPVTQKQWIEIMGSNPSRFTDCDNYPVDNVSWNDAQEYIHKLTVLYAGDNIMFRLPTESEWEYACRASTITPFYTGDALTTHQANYNGTRPYEKCPPGSYLNRPTNVASYPSNEWGIYDMHGNVWEWCSDFYSTDYYERCVEKGMVTNPQGPMDGTRRVLRGGSWGSGPMGCRSALRGSGNPWNRHRRGFRVIGVPKTSFNFGGST